MPTYLYFVQGEDVALKTVSHCDNIHGNNDDITKNDVSPLSSASLASSSLPLLTDFSADTQKLLLAEMLYFEVFSADDGSPKIQNSNIDSTLQDTHAVINAKNINVSTLTILAKQHTTLILQPVRGVLGLWQTQQVYNIFKAMQVLRWYQDHSFCSRCGHRTSQHHKELAMVCHRCHYHQYPRLQPCIIVIITRETIINGIVKKQILLAKNKRFKRDMQSIIAGFVEVGETLEQAVHREVREETALEIKNIRYLGSQPWAFPSNLMIAFHAEYAGGELSFDDDELLSGGFYDIDNLPTIPTAGNISYEMIMHICTGKEMVV